MDESLLRRAAVFHAVGAAGGITAAARRIGKSPPAVHADLRRFEQAIGTALTERVGRSLRLTAQGRAVFESVARALTEIDRAVLAAASDGPLRAPLRLGCVTGFGRYRLVPALLPRLPVERPLLLKTNSHEALLQSLDRGEIDLLLTYRPVVAAPYESLEVATEELVLAGATGAAAMRAAREGRLSFVTYDEYEYVFARWFAEVLGGQPALLRRTDHCSELEEALSSVAAGRGATIAPADACRRFGLKIHRSSCRNTLYLCGTQSALASPEAALLRVCSAPPRKKPS